MAIKLFLTHRRRHRRKRRQRPYGRPTKERVVVGWNSTVVLREKGLLVALALSFFLSQSHRLENYPFPTDFFIFGIIRGRLTCASAFPHEVKSYFAASKARFFSSICGSNAEKTSLLAFVLLEGWNRSAESFSSSLWYDISIGSLPG